MAYIDPFAPPGGYRNPEATPVTFGMGQPGGGVVQGGGVQVVQGGGVAQSGGGGSPINASVLADLFKTPTSSAGTPFVNASQRNPDLDYAISGLKNQLSNDTTGHAIDIAGGKLRDLAEGQKMAAAAGRTARGVSGTGVDTYQNRNIDAGTQRALAGQGTDIALGREAQKDSIYGQIANAGTSAAGVDQGNRSLALQQWQIDQENQRARESAANARQASVLNMLLAAA